jgi:hypothetical protein
LGKHRACTAKTVGSRPSLSTMIPSSSGPGPRPFTPVIAGSNPAGITRSLYTIRYILERFRWECGMVRANRANLTGHGDHTRSVGEMVSRHPVTVVSGGQYPYRPPQGESWLRQSPIKDLPKLSMLKHYSIPSGRRKD